MFTLHSITLAGLPHIDACHGLWRRLHTYGYQISVASGERRRRFHVMGSLLIYLPRPGVLLALLAFNRLYASFIFHVGR